MQPDTSTIPHGLLQILGLLLASSLGWVGGWLTRRKREPAEIAKINAEARQISVNTDVSLMQAATEALTKALHLHDRCNLLEGQIEDLKREVAQERSRADTAEMFTDQLNAAAKLTTCEHHPSGVRLANYTPRQLKPPRT